MDFIKTIDIKVKILLYIGILLILYGFLCQLIPIYFFWESLELGWIILKIALFLVCLKGVKFMKSLNKKAYGPYIGLTVLGFILIVKSIIWIVLPTTDAYQVGYDYLNIESKELGTIMSIQSLPIGGMHMSSNSKGSSGNANLVYLVKGSKKYEKVYLELEKEIETEWKVIE